ncbi:YoaH family protein [Shimwellia pseudoproteus]|uniref:YoaH family protein n=1 Tax=Shimwellia pseudoproteus TaxID=570012 RepID=UPI0018EDE0F7|nr:YoaH family protein [Shimwellia pseudoproteus]MBJ3813744.1 YoaH family protein [Shimwellia pseudoproteus]
MFAGLPVLSHEQQQQAVERIHDLMSQGMTSGEAIATVAAEIRATHTGERMVARFEDDDEDAHQDGEEYDGYGDDEDDA